MKSEIRMEYDRKLLEKAGYPRVVAYTNDTDFAYASNHMGLVYLDLSVIPLTSKGKRVTTKMLGYGTTRYRPYDVEQFKIRMSKKKALRLYADLAKVLHRRKSR